MADSAAPERPIFVVGAHRSGTTLLQSLIGAHPRIAAPPEIGFYGRIWSRRSELGDPREDSVLRTIVELTLDRPTLREAGLDVETTYTRACAGTRTYAGVLAAVLADFATRQGKPRWCEKSPLQPVDWLWDQFPTAQLVHIVRDPRDSVASHRNLPWDNPPAVELARRWLRFTAPALQVGPARGDSSAYLRIRYEDLARAPEKVMRTVFGFLGEDYDPAAVSDPERRRATVPSLQRSWLAKVVGPITPPDEGTWRQRLSRLDQLRVGAVVAPWLPVLGYEPVRRRDARLGAVLNAALAPVERLGPLVRRGAARVRRDR